MKRNTLRSLTLVALGLSAVGATLPVYAATTASVSVSSMYLWRGLSISGAGPAVSGDLYYNHDSGLYAGIWTSSEGDAGSQETDLNVGFSKKFGEFGFDVGAYEYIYPNKVTVDGDSIGDTDASEFYLGGSFGPVSAKILINTEEAENKYLTIDAMFGSFGAHLGSTMAKLSGAEYTDFNVSYMPVANLTFTASKAQGDGAKAAGQEDLQFVVSYKMPFDVK